MKKLTEKEHKRNAIRSFLGIEVPTARNKKRQDKNRKNKGRTPYHSEIIDRLQTESVGAYQIKKVIAQVQIPAVFSLITDPKNSLTAICQLANTARSGQKIKRYEFNHSNMKEMDLAAECILDLVATEISREYRSAKRTLRFGGVYPPNASLRRLLRGIGIIKHLKIEHEYLGPQQMAKIEVFEGRSSKDDVAEPGALTSAEREAKNLVDHINQCLLKSNCQLTEIAVRELSTYASEVMGNADEHSEQSSWFIKGYYDHDEPYYCEVTIVNFGKTIAETFLDIGEDSYEYKKILPYLKKHRKSKLSSKWEVEDLLTVMALQSGISSKNLNKNSTRGMGTVEMIEFFCKIAEECSTTHFPEMAILSGTTHIAFDGGYRLSSDVWGKKIIAFNKTNDLNLPPDPDYVSSTKPLYFPGTVISIRFPLSENQTIGNKP